MAHQAHTTRKSIALLAAGCAALLTGTAALAASPAPTQTQTARVSYADLDLGKPAGTAALYSRIHRAASAVCGDADIRDLYATRARRACMEQAIADAVQGVNHPALTAKHLGKTAPPKLAAREHGSRS